MRKVAHSHDELRERYHCVAQPADPYDTVMIPISVLSSDTLQEIRSQNEILDIFVREHVENAVFEPLEARHFTFAFDSECVVIARKRHSVPPRIVGIMLAKDEADAIPTVLASLADQIDVLYYFAGDVATADAIVANARPGWARAIPDPKLRHTDGLRHFLLEQARRDAETDGDPRPMWIMNIQGDEVYHDDLRRHIMLAQAERATVMTCQVATFLLHESQREGWDWTLPLEQRLTHYIWDFGEHAGFLDFPWLYYMPSEHMRAHPHGLYPARYASARPVRKHYPFRTPEQARARIEDRLKSGWQPHYENYRDVFLSGKAADRDIKRYHGWFGDAERTEGIW